LKHCRLSRPALSRATCNGLARGEARRAATGVPEQSSSREGTLHHITSVTTSTSQSVVKSCILGLCALLEYWTLLTRLSTSYFFIAAETMGAEQSSSREGTLHHSTSVTRSPSQSVVTSCILVFCALLEYWTLLTRLATSYLCIVEAETMGSAPPPAGKQVSPMHIDIYTCVSMHVYVHYYCLHPYIYRCMYTCSAI
jgi:hypothetical protein